MSDEIKDLHIQELLTVRCLCDVLGRICARCTELNELTGSTISTYALKYPVEDLSPEEHYAMKLWGSEHCR